MAGKYSEELGQAICTAIENGMPEYHAANVAGICRRTLARWKKENIPLCHAIKRARSVCMKARIADVMAAAKGGAEVELQKITTKHKDGSVTEKVIRKKTPPTWTAAAWYLERQFCEEFGLNRIDLKELLTLLRASRKDK